VLAPGPSGSVSSIAASKPKPQPLSVAPVERSPLYKQVLGRIEQLMDTGAITPGDRLPAERELAAQLGVSRTSVRQALAALEERGVLEIRHGAGVYMRATEPERVAESLAVVLVDQNLQLPETMEARMALERFIAGLAAGRHTKADIARARAALATMEKEIEAGGLGTQGDAEFHAALAAAAKNPVLQRLMNTLRRDIARVREESLSQPGRPRRSLAAHWRILKAVEAGDPRGAVTEMDAHLHEVADALLLKHAERRQ
jgi:GntR family transcriptional regulator, transcriptional repressor for pyruvate dehydrogenase complex